MKRIKVVHFVPGMASGGVAKVIVEWYKNIDHDKFDFVIATQDALGIFSDEIKNLGCKVVTFKALREVKALVYIKKINEIIQTEKPDIVHSHLGFLSFLVFLCAILNHVHYRIIHSHTNLFYNENKSKIMDLILKIMKISSVKLANYYLACTFEAGKYLYPNRVLYGSRYFTLHNGLTIDAYKYNVTTREKIRKELKVQEKIIIGSVGRLSEQKNQVFSLKVCEYLMSRNIRFELWLIGEGEDEDMLWIEIDRLKLQSYVKLLGVKNNIQDYFQAMDVLLMPSLYEGLGIVAIEAQISGLPCIVSNMVPFEVKVTENVIFYDLNTNQVSEWGDSIVALAHRKRSDYSLEVKQNGYDIYNTVEELMWIYIRAIKGIDC